MKLALIPLLVVLLCGSLRPTFGVANNVVVQWNSALQRTVRKLSISSQISGRYFALLHVAQYQALVQNLADGGDEDLENAIAAFSAHHIASYYFPNEQTRDYDRLIQAQVSAYSPEELAEAREVAYAVAQTLILSRLNDSSANWAQFRFAPNNTVGKYQPTPGQTAALYPQLANTTTFVTPLASEWYPERFASYQPAQVGTPEYNQEYEAVRFYGDANRTDSRDPYQQESPYFWADDVYTHAVTGHWSNITALVLADNVTLLETAEIFSKLHTSIYDGNIHAWYVKYATLFWRPITAIRQGDPYHEAAGTWFPLLNTPAHPEFPSTHSVVCGAAAAVLSRYFGTDDVTFVIGSEYPNQVLVPRRFTKFSSAAIECATSRIYGGIHFPQSGPVGLQIGFEAANYVYENFNKLTPEGGPAPSLGTPVTLPDNDGSFASVGSPQPQPGSLAPGPAPSLPVAQLASQASSAPALPPTAGSALGPAPSSSS